MDRFGEVSIPAVAEDGQGPGVRVDEGDLLGGQREHPVSVVQVESVEQEECEPRGRLAQRLAGQGEQAELNFALHIGEDWLSVLEIEQRYDSAAFGEIAEQILTAGSGRDGGRDDAADAAWRLF